MAAPKEIRTKIKSIQSTQKITRAMEMVAASKMRKAQDRMQTTRPYADRILSVMAHLGGASSEYHHPYLEVRKIKRMGMVLVSTDRGLCGGLNVNMFRFLLEKMDAWQQQGIEVDLCLIGHKGETFFKRLGAPIMASTHHLGDAPTVQDVIGPVGVMLEAYEAQKLDGLCLAYNRFVNTMIQKPVLIDLLPIIPKMDIQEEPLLYGAAPKEKPPLWDYIYEPDAKELIDMLLTRFIESEVYQAAVENFACEQASRMVAMKSATDNAGDIIGELKLEYNKARQAAITRELSEIVAGAAAV